MDREQIIASLLENMGILKRGLYGRLQLSDKFALSHSQLELLFTIRHLGPISSRKLAVQLGLTPGFISQMVDLLLQQNLIERAVDPKDRRIGRLRLSKDGRKVLQNIEKCRYQQMRELMEQLTDRELAVWVRIQQKLISQFQTPAPKVSVK